MRRLLISATMLALLASPVAYAQRGNDHNQRSANQRWDQNGGHDNGRHRGWDQDRGNRHQWRRGQRMGYNDWRDAQRVDYRHYNLRAPPRGYEWRRTDDRFLLVAIGTGLIASVILSAGR